MSHIPALVVAGICKAYRGRPVLREVGFQLSPGEAVALVGPNGAGKSTLLGCITGDRVPDAGTVQVCGGDPLSDHRAAARCMGVVPEQPTLYGELSVGEMLQFAHAAREPSPPAGEADRLLGLLGLAGAESLLCRELSQGMGRKLAIVLALVHRPRLIVLDEATNGLDAASVQQLGEELLRRRADGAAVLLASHDQELVAAWCERGIRLEPGAGHTLFSFTREE